ncbi:glycosyl transferase family 2 [[Leptolyngbya] sp. PCC 7376]|uniref:glycosyltransferase family 2 protein n=1 Tax=[Leptolyngbya] sp. PCC 7376 TaxID=111781 RepID=UPI00029F1AA4|nr:glycosyltransferase family 2 protein [[Leptolyngbya] sp. PCC 7376]AFY39809.1 glycosyl transferase family 2 [[Leptolyngbya] sp. PCC 7376]
MSTLEPQLSLKNKTVTLRDRTLLLRYMVIVNLIIGVWYLHWRWTDSLNMQALWFAVPLICAETYMFFGGVMFFYSLWRPIKRTTKSLAALTPSFPTENYPTVDIFITCYNEPADMVELTARAALKMDYPSEKLRVYILDDGNSPEMRDMTATLCLEDLKTPAVKNAAEHINQQKYRCETRINQLRILKKDLVEVEGFIDSYQLSIPSKKQELAYVMDWLNQLRPNKVSEKTWIICQTILGEGLDNAITHAHKYLSPDQKIDLEFSLFNHAFILKIWDQGSFFDLEAHLQNLKEEVDVEAEHGRGLGIIRQLVDYFSYVRTDNEQNCLVLIKKFESETISTERDRIAQNQGYIHSLRELLLLSNPNHHTTTDICNSEIQQLEKQVNNYTQRLIDLPRCRYIARKKPKGRPHHAKAGNINHAIFSGETHGELVLTLDADHIPQTKFLQRVIPNFYRFNVDRGHYELNKVAFVQTPQAFSNLPSDDPFGHNARVFYGPIQQGKDGMNSAFYTGTNAVLRREALIRMGLQHFADDYAADERKLEEFEMIGGLSSISITEDMNTAMRLHSKGWYSIYHDEVLAEGLAPDDLSSTLQQKLRWAQGTIQVLLRDNPLFKTGLSFSQRVQYFQTMYSYFAGFFVLVLLLCPLVSLTTGLIPVNTFGIDFAWHFVPAYILNRITFWLASWGIPWRELWRNEQYAIALFPLQIQAVTSVFTGKSLKFKVTPKQRQSGVYFRLIPVQILFFIATILALIWGGIQVFISTKLSSSTYLINTVWCIYHLALLWSVIRAAYWQPKNNN